jgi:hypothetical protein
MKSFPRNKDESQTPVALSSASIGRLQRTTTLALPSSLTSGEDLLTSQLASPFQETTLTQLSAHTFIHAILDSIDILVTRDLGLGEIVYSEARVGKRQRRKRGAELLRSGMQQDFPGICSPSCMCQLHA